MLIAMAIMLPLCTGLQAAAANNPDIIPRPAHVEEAEGIFVFDKNIPIVFQGEDISKLAEFASDYWASPLGFRMPVEQIKYGHTGKAVFLAYEQPNAPDLGTEGYRLNIQPEKIFLSANTRAGLFYGTQTIYKLLTASHKPELSAASIIDYPRFAYRGMHLDVSRHFMPIEFIFKMIDYMALHKLNVFHWHLIDDQGWRLEIKKYPGLTETGAWRVDMPDLHWNERPLVNDPDNATYGGYYTQEEVRALVEYAAERHIAVMPEIEMPAHVMSALAAYPEFSCTGDNLGVPPGGVWPITHIYCAGNDSTFLFLKDVLTEVMDIFPSTYIHIGGDEADKSNWKACAKCQARMEAEGLANEKELQSYFIRRIEHFLNAHGRRMIGWDEILEGGLAPNATVMSWRGVEGGIEAAKMGHTVVMTPGSHCYFDHYQGDPAIEPPAIGGYTTLAKVYSFEPVPEALNEEEARLVLGAQANVWTEYMPVPEHVEYMVFPRLAALSEVLWTPVRLRHWGDFSKRIKTQYHRYEQLGINYSLSAFQVTASPEIDPDSRKLFLKLDSEVYQPKIRYTLDGSMPGKQSPVYKKPIEIGETSTLKAVVFQNGKSMQQVLVRDYHIHKAFAADIQLKHPNSAQYDGHGEYSLVNGVRGTKSYSDGNWKGFHGDNLIALIDLGEATNISSIQVEALQTVASWIFLPQRVHFEVSADGEQFVLLETVENDASPYEMDRIIHSFSTDISSENMRYIRVSAENLGVCPPGHSGEGSPAWLFVSEIMVE